VGIFSEHSVYTTVHRPEYPALLYTNGRITYKLLA